MKKKDRMKLLSFNPPEKSFEYYLFVNFFFILFYF